MEKGKKARHGEEDDFLHLVMMDYGNQYGSSPLPPLRASTCESATDPDGENMRSNGSSSDSSASSSKWEYSVIDEMEDADEDDFFSKFLSISNPVSPATADDASSKLPTQFPPEMAVQSPRAAAKGGPRALRKAMTPEMLAELSMQDPKKARRIITNRMSAVRAKEKKKLYTFMLEHKLQTLQSEAAALAAHLALLQTESIGLNAENIRLKEQTSIVLRQIRFQDSLNEEIRNEISRGNYGYKNPAIVSAIGREQFHHHHHHHYHQAPNPGQVDQLQHGVEQMNIRQQYLWQFPNANQQGQSPIHQKEENPPSNGEPAAIEDPNNNTQQNPPSNQLS